jgi:CRISPR/Cas system-associated exonuclease Cas4 (RecB family)
MKAFMFNVTDDMRQNLEDYIHECDGYVERQITPPKPENVTRKSCTYCGYREQCKKDG